jgi:hypothetical protein
MLDVDSKDLLQMPPPNDQQPVEALGAHGSNPAFRMGVRIGRPHGRQQHPGALRAEHVVEAAAEFRVAVAEHKAQLSSPLPEHQQQVAGLLGDPGPVGMAVTPARWTCRVSSSMKNSTYSRRSQMVSTVKKVAREDPSSLLAQERAPGDGCPPRGGVKPVAAEGGADRGC